MTKKVPVLPIEAYTSEDWFKNEQETIFSNTWQFAGFAEEFKKPGDYITVQVGLNNIMILLSEDNTLKAFHNMCRHRGTQLLRTVGNVKKIITCPYHDWSYNTDGELLTVPDMKNEFPDLDKKKLCLHTASVEVFKTMVFVHPDPNAESFTGWLSGAEDKMGPHKPELLVEYEGTSSVHEVNANWKIIVENYIDGYHLSHLHSNTLNMYDHSKQVSGFCGPHYVFYEPYAEWYKKDIDKASPLPLIPDIPPAESGAYVPMLFPNIGISIDESSWNVFNIIPVSATKSIIKIRTRLVYTNEKDFAKKEKASNKYFRDKRLKYGDYNEDDPMSTGDFMAEDIFACEQQQKSFQSPLFSVGATAKSLEDSVRKFQTIVNDYVNK